VHTSDCLMFKYKHAAGLQANPLSRLECLHSDHRFCLLRRTLPSSSSIRRIFIGEESSMPERAVALSFAEVRKLNAVLLALEHNRCDEMHIRSNEPVAVSQVLALHSVPPLCAQASSARVSAMRVAHEGRRLSAAPLQSEARTRHASRAPSDGMCSTAGETLATLLRPVPDTDVRLLCSRHC